MKHEMNHYNCIYMYINKINGKKYVGQTVNFNRRHYEHLRGDLVIDNAIRKYGIDNFEIVILIEDLDSVDEMNKYEIEYIKQYESLLEQHGYNVSTGGNGWEVTNEFRQQCSERNKGDNNYFHEHKFIGKDNHFYGKHHTEETKDKLRKSWEDKYEHGYVNPNKGNKISEVTKQKMRETIQAKYNDGYESPRKGVQHTEETKQKMKENHADFTGGKHPRAVVVAQYDLQGNLIKTFPCLKNASEELGISYSTAKKLVKDKAKSYKGIVLVRLDKEEESYEI